MRLLIIGDNPRAIRGLTAFHSISKVSTAVEAVELLSLYEYDAVLVTYLLGRDGDTALAYIRKHTTLPIVVVAQYGTVEDKIRAFQLGADEYVIQSTTWDTLQARLCVHVRRYYGYTTSVLQAGNLFVDIQDWRVHVGQNEVVLSPSHYRILELLMLKRTPVSRELFLDMLHIEHEVFFDERSIDMLIKRLRKKITDVSGGVDYIRTIYGLGYVVRDLAESV